MPAVRSFFVVHLLPSPGEDHGVLQGEEDLGIKHFAPIGSDEALCVAVLPWLSRVDVGHTDIVALCPHSNGVGNELTAVVATQKRRLAVLLNRLVEDTLDIASLE